jgi:hypothetical protein
VIEGYKLFGEPDIQLPDEIDLPEYFSMLFLAKKLGIPLAKIVEAFSGFPIKIQTGGYHKIKLNESGDES